MTQADHTTKDPAVLTPDEARAAQKTGHMRYVLGISLGLAILMVGGLAAYFMLSA